MKKSFMTNVIAPLRLVDRTVFIFISSPGVATAYYTQLMKNPAFNTIKFSMACAACEKTMHPWKCTHMLGEIPHWQSEESVQKAKRFLADDPLIEYRELMGGDIDDAAKVFSLDLLNQLEAKPHVGYGMQPPKYVVVSIDPSGGGSSHYAITSCFYTGPVCVVCGIDSRPGKTWESQKVVMTDHIKRLQRDPLLSKAWFVIQIESNYGLESDHHAEVLQRDPDIINLAFMRESAARVGTLTTHGTKEQMTLLMMEVISMQSMVIYEKLVTTEDDPEAMKRLLFRQLENFSAKGSLTGKRVFTGKVNHEQDDLAMTLMMNMLYFRKFTSDHERYGRYHRHAPR